MPTAGADPTLQFSLVYTPTGQSDVVIDTAPIDIRPLQNWATAVSVRSTDTPLQQADFRPVAQYFQKSTWEAVPADAKTITVLVHGFSITASSAETSFFPTYLKRLYWTGHPVLDTHTADGQNFSHVVGFEWPGDEGLTIGQAELISPTDPGITLLASLLAVSGETFYLYFPEDEFHALESGVPFVKLINDLNSPAMPRTIHVISHSLGNMVVNSALTSPNLPAQAINTYIMNEAAVPSETFGIGTFLPDVLGQAQKYGYSPTPQADCILNPTQVDCLWQTEWNDMVAGNPPIIDPETGLSTPDHTDYNNWCAKLTSPAFATTPLPLYENRWRQTRPSGGVTDPDVPVDGSITTCGLPNSQPMRGPWQGLFGNNPTRVNKLVNTWNKDDFVLGFDSSIPGTNIFTTGLWRWCQVLQKPNTGFLGLGSDNRAVQFWANLADTGPSEQSVFGDNQKHSNIVRQWAELAQWFPATTQAVGVGPISPQTGAITNIPFYTFTGGATSGTSHTYLGSQNLHSVWCAFRNITHAIDNDTLESKCQPPAQ